jgi:tRNA dimethylallyltransferase
MAASDAPDLTKTSEKIPIVIICGPTASGKSSLAISIAQEFDAEIISADSRQIYRQLKLGTDRLDQDEWQGIPHYLMGEVDLGQRFTVFDFVQRAKEAIADIHERGKRIIVCGGTGFYIRALTQGIYELPDDDMKYREELLDMVSAHGVGYLHDKLKDVDPKAAAELHPHNFVRVIRALEIYHLTGLRRSEQARLPTTRNENLRFLQIILMPPRDALYRKIEKRVDQMVQEGLIEETRRIYESDLRKALLQAKIVGYDEVTAFLEGHMEQEEAVNLIKQNTRRYAKRQYTWFRAVKKARILEHFGNEARSECVKLIKPFWAASLIK